MVLVNTCGFLEAAVEESLDTIREMVRLKETAGVRGVVVTGCLAERKIVDIAERVPEVDAVVPFADYDRLVSICRDAAGRPESGDRAGDYRQGPPHPGRPHPPHPSGIART